MEQITLNSDVENIRIDSWLSSKLQKYSRTYLQKLIDENCVKVNGRSVKPNYKVKMDDEVIVSIPEPQILEVKPEKISLDIVYEDNDILVINKPKNMVVHPAAGNYSGTLVNALMEYCGDTLSGINGIIRPGIVHRIDKDTSGLLVVAKNDSAHEGLSAKLKKHEIMRVYVALVHGVIREGCGKVEAPIGRHPVDRKIMAVNTKNGKRAVTHFKVIERYKNATYIELNLETGRTHQIRVHMSYIGHPIIGDRTYGGERKAFNTNGQALHAKKLVFEHPVTREMMEFEADPPEEFKIIQEKLRIE
jgi:23S rRNA pseudouridine1911/1915/1917 synthase